MYGLLMFLLGAIGVFMILLVLVQRGKGGGLSGAFGGMGGQSAFGTKAGDLFTRITIGTAFVWILVCVFTLKYLSTEDSLIDSSLGGAAVPQTGISNRIDGKPVEGAGGASGKAPAGGAGGTSAPSGDSGSGSSDTPATE